VWVDQDALVVAPGMLEAVSTRSVAIVVRSSPATVWQARHDSTMQARFVVVQFQPEKIAEADMRVSETTIYQEAMHRLAATFAAAPQRTILSVVMHEHGKTS
jgi:hypothetical protein